MQRVLEWLQEARTKAILPQQRTIIQNTASALLAAAASVAQYRSQLLESLVLSSLALRIQKNLRGDDAADEDWWGGWGLWVERTVDHS